MQQAARVDDECWQRQQQLLRAASAMPLHVHSAVSAFAAADDTLLYLHCLATAPSFRGLATVAG